MNRGHKFWRSVRQLALSVPRRLLKKPAPRKLEDGLSLHVSNFSWSSLLGKLYSRSREPAKRENCKSHCHGSVFQQHDPARDQPRTTKRAQMPNVVSGDDAHCPDDQWHRRGGPHERQQPEKVPRIYDGCIEKRCCHGPRKCVRSRCRGFASHPDCSKKAGEQCQPNCK